MANREERWKYILNQSDSPKLAPEQEAKATARILRETKQTEQQEQQEQQQQQTSLTTPTNRLFPVNQGTVIAVILAIVYMWLTDSMNYGFFTQLFQLFMLWILTEVAKFFYSTSGARKTKGMDKMFMIMDQLEAITNEAKALLLSFLLIYIAKLFVKTT